LIAANLKRLGDVVQMTPPQLLRLRNFGAKSLEEIASFFASANLNLGTSLEGWDQDSGWLDATASSNGVIVQNNLSENQRAFLVLRLIPRNFSRKVGKLIEAGKLKRIGDLAGLSPEFVLQTVGYKSLQEIDKFLAIGNIRIGTSIENWNEKLAASWEAELLHKGDLLNPWMLIDPYLLDRDIKFLEDELHLITKLAFGLSRDRSAQIVTRLLGFDGSGKSTLEQVGEEFDLTRQRVQQVVEDFRRRLEGKLVNCPVLKRTQALVLQYAPNVGSQIQIELRKHGLTATEFDCAGVAAALLEFGVEPRFDVFLADGQQVVGEPALAEPLRQATKTAKKLAGSIGCVHVDDVADKIGLTPDESLRRCLSALLERTRSIRWLDEDHKWFAIAGTKRVRLATLIRKVLAITPAIGVIELHDALRRVHQLRLVRVPPQAILVEFCKTLDFIDVVDKQIVAQPQPSIDETLGETERCLYEVLRRSGPAMRSDRLRDECLGKGMNENTFYQYLQYSPTVRELAPEVYSLVGANVPEENVRRLQSTRLTEPT
jgi:hypothetical protein